MEMKFLKFDKSRWIIFIVLFLLSPSGITYGGTPCRLFGEPGPFAALCGAGTFPLIFPVFVTATKIDKHGRIDPLNYVIALFFAFVFSYPLNALYKWVVKKVKRRGKSI